MKYVFGYLLIVILTSCGSVTKAFSEEKLEGPVIKKITEYSYQPKIDSLRVNRDSLFSSGNLTYTKYNTFGTISEHARYNVEGNLVYRTLYTFNESNKFLSGIKKTPENEVISQWYYHYNKKGKLLLVNTLGKDSVLIRQQFNKFKDAKFNGLTIIDIKRKDTTDHTYNYNSKGELIEVVINSSYPAILSKRVYEYDDKGNRVSEYLHRINGGIEKIVSKYDKNNNIVESQNYKPNQKKSIKNTYIFNYDKHNNWITKKSYSNGKLTIVEERYIEYY